MSPRPDRRAWLEGPGSPCDVAPQPQARTLRMILMGPPGVGKGTQGELLAARFGACQLTTGDIFRAARHVDACHRTPALAQALACMDRGSLVPDDTVVQLVRERRTCLQCLGGFILDGFPRTVAQAEALDALLASEGVELDAVIALEMPLDAIAARLGGRRSCPRCKAVYHVESRPPREGGICDACGSALVQRPDDHPGAVRVRMETYRHSTEPLLAYYDRAGVLRRVSADGSPEAVHASIARVLERSEERAGL